MSHAKIYHVLNGDALKHQFPKQLAGELIIARECLVDGDVSGDTIEEIFDTRASVLDKLDDESEVGFYNQKVKPELEKIRSIAEADEVNLWFEDDLFCQVNLWFVAYLLEQARVSRNVYLVRPPELSPYGFGGLNQDELMLCYHRRLSLDKLSAFAGLWEYYQKQDHLRLLELASALVDDYPFILPAVQAHLDRIPEGRRLGRPHRIISEIIADLGSEDFGPVFRAFCEREPIYGFGDIQVRRLLDEVITNHGS